MGWVEGGFWACFALVVYAYALYPLALALLVRLRGRPLRRGGAPPRSVSVVIAARNEEATIGRRVREFFELAATAGVVAEVIIVSDGSDDGTAAEARREIGTRGRVVELSGGRGKAAALNAGVAEARHEILVFGDARQYWAPGAVARLLENFADPQVGAASGDLVVEARPGVMAGVGLYWRYEKWIRRQEGRLHSTVGLTGAICAVRRELFRPIPAGTLLDDVYWPLRVVMQGYRVVHDEKARAFDRLPDRPRDEFRRKVRTLSGNLQLAARLPAALVPGRNPVWFQFVSHKLLRLAVPWAVLAMLVTSAVLPGPVYRAALAAQAAGFLIGLAGLWPPVGSRSRLASAGASFLVLNAAAWLAFWVWLTGRAGRSWGKVHYRAGETRPGDVASAAAVPAE